jgi:hypothetical protein
MADYIPKPDGEAAAYGERVVAAIEADEASFGLLPADSLALRAKLDAFKTKLAASDAAKAAAKTAVADKDTARDEFEAALRPTVQRVQLNPVVTDAIRVGAGLPVRDMVRTTSAPIAPRDLVAVADASGSADLKWNANGNASGIRFVVQKKPAGALEFSNVDVVTATKLRVRGLTVGQRCEFRVLARRGSADSGPSNVASIY